MSTSTKRVDGTTYCEKDGSFRKLERKKLVDKDFDEGHLQHVLEQCPDLLPFSKVDIRAGRLFHACRELRAPNGSVDHVYIGENQEIAIVETKLWRNPEARRQVLGQIVDYATAIQRMSYSDFEKSVNSARGSNESLYKMYSDYFCNDTSSDEFFNGIMQTLKRGSFILLIVGDEIRTEVEEMTLFLNKFSGIHFSLGLVELRIYAIEGGRLYLPLLVAQTEIIQRTIVVVDDKRIVVDVEDRDNAAPIAEIRHVFKGARTAEEYVKLVETECGAIAAANMRTVLATSADAGFVIEWRRKMNSIVINLPNPEGIRSFTAVRFGDSKVPWISFTRGQIRLSLPNVITDNVAQEIVEELAAGISNIIGQIWTKDSKDGRFLLVEIGQTDTSEKLRSIVDLYAGLLDDSTNVTLD